MNNGRENGSITVYRAAAVATMAGPVLRDAAVATQDGKIVAVGPAAALLREIRAGHSGATVNEHDLGRVVVLPGLINAHTHLELSHCTAGDEKPASFIDWITSLPQKTRRTEPDFEDRVAAAARHGAEESLRFGVTTVGDITAHPHITRPALRKSGLRVVSFGEALGLAKARSRFESSLVRAVDESDRSETLSIGLSPHAPYTVDRAGYEHCVASARDNKLPLATHLAETRDEETFLRHHRGPFRDIWEKLGSWDDNVEAFDGSPAEFMRSVGLLDHPHGSILAHVNYCDNATLDTLAAGRASVVFCPRTHLYFDHPPHRWREMIERGINVAVGTDSCASSPNLDIVEDLRLLFRRHGHAVESELLWSLVTSRAAKSLQIDDNLGTLEPGKLAEFTAFPMLADVDPLGALLDAPSQDASLIQLIQ